MHDLELLIPITFFVCVTYAIKSILESRTRSKLIAANSSEELIRSLLISEEQQRGLLGVTIRFLAGEQNVTNELVPMLAAAQALGRFDWTTYLSTFLMEEAKHAEFFMRWHDKVVGVLEPEEVAQHFLVRGKTIDPSGRFEVRDVLHEALPYYGRRLLESTLGGEEAEIERNFVAFSAG